MEHVLSVMVAYSDEYARIEADRLLVSQGFGGISDELVSLLHKYLLTFNVSNVNLVTLRSQLSCLKRTLLWTHKDVTLQT